MNWGKKIMIFYAVFVAGIMFMVFRTMEMEQDLVAPDYYVQELKYQQRIDDKKRTAELKGKVSVSKYEGGLEIVLPDEITSRGFVGEVWIYCPSDKSKDMKVNFNLASGKKNTRIPYLYKGYRQIKINGTSMGKTYYFEEKVYL